MGSAGGRCAQSAEGDYVDHGIECIGAGIFSRVSRRRRIDVAFCAAGGGGAGVGARPAEWKRSGEKLEADAGVHLRRARQKDVTVR